MPEEELIGEIRTIKTLLALDKKEELDQLHSELSQIQIRVLEELETEWSSPPTADLAEEFDVSQRTVQNQINDLIEKSFLQRRGSGRGVEYRNTGLVDAMKLVRGEL